MRWLCTLARAEPNTSSSDAAAAPTAKTPAFGAWLDNTQQGGALPIPPLYSPPIQNGVRTFDLSVHTGQVAFEPAQASTLGINSPYLGPTLRASPGETVAFNIVNTLSEATALHWHGMHLPPIMDGGPLQPIAPGGMWRPTWTIRQQPATLWYHSHLMGQTRAQVTRGLAGIFIVTDVSPAQTALPSTYGVDDFPLIFQDYLLGGAKILVNGGLSPLLVANGPRLRLRLLNASNQEILRLGFSGEAPFDQVASDGGLLNAPVRLTQLTLGPAERVEIVIDLSDAPLALQHFGANGDGRGNGSGTGTLLLTIQPPSGTRGADPAPVRSQLNTIERADPTAAAVARQMVLGGNVRSPTINGQSMDTMADLMDLSKALRVRLGDVERWNVVNSSGGTHLFHVHGVQFQILDRDGMPPPATEAGQKDTVLVRPGETVSLPHPIHGLRRRGLAIHVPLPYSSARGPGDDGAIRRGAHKRSSRVILRPGRRVQ